MRIKSLEIKNFRSIEECLIYLDVTNAIVGENNAGKTNILRALNSFFNYNDEKKCFEDETHRYKPRRNSYISVTLENIPNNKILNKYKDRNDNLCIEFRYKYTSKKHSYRTDGKTVPKDVISEIRKYIEYVYVPAGRSNFDLDWSQDSIFSRLIEEYTKELIKKRDNVSKSVKDAGTKFHKSILSKIEKKINELYLIESNNKFEINYSTDLNYKIFMNLLRLNVVEYGRALDIVDHGSGTTSLSIITIYRALAQILGCNIYLGIEEPETNLHPQAQKKLINSLAKSREENEIQTIFTTHSTVIIDELSHEQIILVRREVEKSRGFKSTVTQLNKKFWDEDEIKNIKYSKFFKIKNSAFFFSKYVIIFESIVDAEVYKNILEKKMEKKLHDVSFFSLDGVDNLIYPVKLFKQIGIPFSTVVDRDFFTLYKNNKKKKSRDAEGFYIYKNTLNNSNKKVITLISDDSRVIDKLSDKLESSYSKLFDSLKEYKLYSMKYCLEQDMITSKKFRACCYDELNLPEEQRELKTLLIDRHNKIKKPEFILNILDKMEIKEYPYTINKIANSLIEDLKASLGELI